MIEVIRCVWRLVRLSQWGMAWALTRLVIDRELTMGAIPDVVLAKLDELFGKIEAEKAAKVKLGDAEMSLAAAQDALADADAEYNAAAEATGQAVEETKVLIESFNP